MSIENADAAKLTRTNGRWSRKAHWANRNGIRNSTKKQRFRREHPYIPDGSFSACAAKKQVTDALVYALVYPWSHPQRASTRTVPWCKRRSDAATRTSAMTSLVRLLQQAVNQSPDGASNHEFLDNPHIPINTRVCVCVCGGAPPRGQSHKSTLNGFNRQDRNTYNLPERRQNRTLRWTDPARFFDHPQ